MANERDKHNLGIEEIEAVSRVIRSGKLFRYQNQPGECRKFEESFARKFGANYAILVTSGTNALVAALLASKIGAGDEVIIPAYTFVATAAAVLNVGAIPVVVNIDQKLGINVDEIGNKITSKTKAIIPVHMDGMSCDICSVIDIAKKHNLIVIEDTCQAMGGTNTGRHLGTLGRFGCYSLNMDKIITCGEGGIVVTNSREDYETLCCVSDSAFSFSPHHADFFKAILPTLGQSMRASEISGAIAREQLKKIDLILNNYRQLKNEFLSFFYDQKDRSFTIINGYDRAGDCGTSVHLLCNNPIAANDLGKKLRENGIPAIPPSMRPAHIVWKWSHMLGKRSHVNTANNPYLLSKFDYDHSYEKFNYLETLDIVSRVLKFEIDFAWTLEDANKKANLICDLVRT